MPYNICVPARYARPSNGLFPTHPRIGDRPETPIRCSTRRSTIRRATDFSSQPLPRVLAPPDQSLIHRPTPLKARFDKPPIHDSILADTTSVAVCSALSGLYFSDGGLHEH